MHEQHCIPARRVLRQAAAVNRRNGHENSGFLSEDHGFLPTRPPLEALPPTHRAWDDAAALLPQLYQSRSVRASLEQLDLLPADAAALPAPFLLRASALLSIFAHAYVRCELSAPVALPPAIEQPWATVSRRLGRRAPVLSYIDLVVYNWRLLDPLRADPMRVENMRLLVPTVDNQEERVFYLTQLEILAGCTPLVASVVRAQEAVATRQSDALKQELRMIAGCLSGVTRCSLSKIDPHPRSQTYVDPIVWAKTVAPFAVPLDPGVPGPSGTSSPIFHLLDVFFGRRTHISILGAEMLALRTWYPRHWRSMLHAIAQISVSEYVERTADHELRGLFMQALRAYADTDGFLGRHRLKVAGYLELAFKVGRNVTIGGFSGLFDDRTWETVDQALDAARRERVPESSGGAGVERRQVAVARSGGQGAGAVAAAGEPDVGAAYDVSELVLHNNDRSGYWLLLDDGVYDLTTFARLHPGGFHVLRGYAGMDATAAFRRVGHAAHPGVRARLARYRIGSIRRLRFAPPGAPRADALGDVYRAWIRTLFVVVELENALHNEYTILCTADAGDAARQAPSPYRLQLAVEAHRRFVSEHLKQLCGDRFAELWAATVAHLAPDEDDMWLKSALTAVWSSAAGRATVRRAEADAGSTASRWPVAAYCELLEREDKRLLYELKLLLRAGVQQFEAGEPHAAPEPGARLLSSMRRLPGAIVAYCARLQAAGWNNRLT